MSSRTKVLGILAKHGGTWGKFDQGGSKEVTIEAPDGMVFASNPELHGIVAADGDTMEECWAAALDDLTGGGPVPFVPCDEDECEVCGA